MESRSHEPRQPNVVYVRTAKGQQELVVPSIGLGPWERRFLACVTGFTPLQLLLDLGLADAHADAGIRHLLGAGLMAEVDPGAAEPRRSRPAVRVTVTA